MCFPLIPRPTIVTDKLGSKFRRSMSCHICLRKQNFCARRLNGYAVLRQRAGTRLPGFHAEFLVRDAVASLAQALRCALRCAMPSLQEQYDDAMFDFSTGDYDSAIVKLKTVLASDASHFEAQLALGMAYYRKGDYKSAIEEGRKAEKMKPGEQLVHTNLSLFYMKAGDKGLAEHHGLQARISSWRQDAKNPAAQTENPELQIAKPETQPSVSRATKPEKFPDMPWKKKPVDS
jgi:tetratricopeptide (TPR) repeat protein